MEGHTADMAAWWEQGEPCGAPRSLGSLEGSVRPPPLKKGGVAKLPTP